MTKFRITQDKSSVRATERQQATLASLGIRKIHQIVEVENNPVIKGMIEKVLHLVKVEEIN